MKLKLTFLCVVLGLQASWIAGTTVVQENVLRHGTIVLLETRPVDPRDLLRGDYLILNYKISDIPLKLFTPAITNTPDPGQAIYVALQLKGAFHEVVEASTKPFVPKADEVLVKGTSRWWWANANSVHVDYGLERYYVREKTGNPRGKITVQAAVSGSGHCLIRQVFLDGKPYAEAMKTDVSENLR